MPSMSARTGEHVEPLDRGAIEEIRWLLPYARRHSGLIALTVASSVGLAVIDIPLPFFLKHVIDAVLAHHRTDSLLGMQLQPREFLFAIFVCHVCMAVIKGGLQ